MIIKINRTKFFALKPTLVGIVSGVSYYEDPIHGDEATLIAVTAESIEHTAHYEMQDIHDELEDELYEAAARDSRARINVWLDARAAESAAIKASIKF